MARSSSALLKGCKGHLGKNIVVKQYGNKIVLSKYPDMGSVKRSAKQRDNSKVFAAAVAYAKDICNDSRLRAVYELKKSKGEKLFQFAIKEFYTKYKCE